MKAMFLAPLFNEKKNEYAPFSQAEMHLASLMRKLRSHYETGNYKSFETYMTREVDGMSFTKSEVKRLWKALHKVSITYASIENVKCFDRSHSVVFPDSFYRNNSNFFENYAKEVMLREDIVQQRGRVKGKVYPPKAKKAEEPVVEQVENGILVDGHFHEDIFHEPSKEEVQETPIVEEPVKRNFEGLSLEELRALMVELTAAISEAEAEEKRRADIRHQYETLRNAAAKILEENPWLQ